MLQIWLCSDRKINTEKVLNAICDNAARGQEGQLLIVPEQFSHMTERQLCLHGGDCISRFAEVLGFSRLADRVFSVDGGCAETDTDTVGSLLMMSLAVEQVRSRLKIYGVSATRPEFLLRLQTTFDEFRSFCVTPERLRQASAKLSGVLAEKTEEFALLMESYDAVSAQMGQNSETKLTRLLHALETGRFVEGKCFFFDGFTDFNGVEYEIIAQLLNRGAELTVSLHCDGIEAAGQQFSAARQTAKTLLRIAAQTRQEVKLLVHPARQEKTALSFLRAKAFSGAIEPYLQPQEEVKLLRGSDAVEQIRAAAGEILRLVENGARWRDISVACADYGAYRPIVESLFQRAQIPAYFAGDTDILQKSVSHMLLTALEAACKTMDTETVLSYLKSGFVPLAQERCDRMENYVLMWRISGSMWERPWTMNPDDFRQRPNDAAMDHLQQLEQDRLTAISPLLHLATALKKAANTAQMVLAVYDFMQEIELENTLNRYAQAQYDSGDLQKSQEYVQIYGIICKLLEQMYGVLGQSVRSPENFYRIFRVALSQSKVGTIPASLDCVTVGSLMSQRRCDTDYVMLLGANEGVFPSAQASAGLLTDNERISLLSLGVELAPTAAGSLERELSAIDSVFNAPNKCLYLSASDEKEAYLFRRTLALLPDAAVLRGDSELIAHAEREYLSYLASEPERISAVQDSPKLREKAQALLMASAYQVENLKEESVKALYGKTLSLSSSKIDMLASCRFSYFLQYGLRAKERETAQIDPRMYGTFVHDVLEHTVKQVMQEGGFHTVSEERVMQLAQERMEQYVQQELADLFESARAEYLFRRNFSEIRMIVADLYRELSVSAFEPKWFELRFSDKDSELPAIRIVGQKAAIKLEGCVDRADLWTDGNRTYVRVIDYKTNKKDFNYTKILNGLLLQMLLYLFTLKRHGQKLLQTPLVPAGVLYFEAKAENSSKASRPNEEELLKLSALKKRTGLLLDDTAVLQAMEPCTDDPSYLPYQYNKEHERKGNLYMPQQLQALETYVYKTVAALADELYKGEISPNPYVFSSDNACEYCRYATVCRGKKQERRLERVDSASAFWEKIGEVTADGEI